MSPLRRNICFPMILAFVVAIPVSAFDYPLSDTAIRDAFLTGNNNRERAAELFVKYAHSLPAPDSGPYVASVTIMTPYEQVAERGATVTNYHAEEAEEEFLGKPIPFLVRVQIEFTPTYPAYPPPGPNGAASLLQPLPDYQNDFKISVSQDQPIAAKASRAYLVSSSFSHNIWNAAGLVIEQQFDPERIDSSNLTVDIQTPDGQDVATIFNLAEIR
jgi:hypothetical protein